MKLINLLFTGIILMHGLIHLMGFVKAFKLAEIQGLSLPISKTSGLFWLLTAILFMAGCVLYWLKLQGSTILFVLGIILSAILIIPAWSDAKFGIIPNIMALILVFASLSSCNVKKLATSEVQEILSTYTPNMQVVAENDLIDLPLPVKNWLSNSGIVGKPYQQTVLVHQKALIKLKPEHNKWNEATAEQYITTTPPAFVWSVNLNLSPFIKIKGRDKYQNGKGEMLIKMNNLVNVVNAKGPKMDEGTLQRYLGEMVWYPSAALSTYITWEQLDGKSARATMSYKGLSGSGVFEFNEAGEFVKFSAMRYKGNDDNSKRYNWTIDVSDYAVFEGIKVPSKMISTWSLESGDWTWMDLTITNIKYNVNQ